MTKHRSMKLGMAVLTAVGATTVGLTVGAAGATAPPATPATLAQIKARAATAVSKRIASLNSAVSRVEGAKNLGSEAPTLVIYLQNDITPLQNLGATIAADTTQSSARADAKEIFVNYRVCALVLPAARQAARADVVTGAVVPRLSSLAEKAQSYVTSANQATLQPMIDSLKSDISGADGAASGVATTVLGYSPSQWNANHALLSSTRTGLETAAADVKSARNEAQQIRQFLRSSLPSLRRGGRGTTTPTP